MKKLKSIEDSNIINEFNSEIEKHPLSTGNWYTTFMYMNIPVIGWLYLLILTKSKTQPLKKEFAKAYLLYKLTMLAVCILLIVIACCIVLPYVEQLLDYMELL